MPTPANPTALAQQARQSYVEGLLNGLPAVVQAVMQGARILVSQVAEPGLAMKRREILPELTRCGQYWQQGMTSMLRGARLTGMVLATRPGDLPLPSTGSPKLSLVDDDTIERFILKSQRPYPLPFIALNMADEANKIFVAILSSSHGIYFIAE